MKLTYFRGNVPNFGDELNRFMWQELLPVGFLDDSEDDLFLGIGSILWDDFPKPQKKHVIGSGFGGYTAIPDVHDGKWNIVWVRGPRTARALGIDEKMAITDSAILLRAIELPPPVSGIDIAFMPHFQSVERGNWRKVCSLAGIHFLDPRDPPEELIAKIRGARLVLTEAMHGAIVSDALRTPFIPFLPIQPSHRAKWDDWADSLGIELHRHLLRSSTAAELYISKKGADGSGPVSSFLMSNPIAKIFDEALTRRAAQHLRYVAENAVPILSHDSRISSATDRCHSALHKFVTATRRGEI